MERHQFPGLASPHCAVLGADGLETLLRKGSRWNFLTLSRNCIVSAACCVGGGSGGPFAENSKWLVSYT